jgi:hypothetical protein
MEALQDANISNDLSFWNKATFFIYDLPTQHHLGYEDRVKKLHELVAQLQNSNVQIMEPMSYNEETVKKMVAIGETVWLRKPKSWYFQTDSFYELRVRNYKGKSYFIGP